MVETLRSREAELLLVDAGVSLPQSWSTTLQDFELRESVRLSTAIDGVPSCCHIVGSPSKLQRFGDVVGQSASSQASFAAFLDAAEIPPFPNARYQDPFGQNPYLMSEGWEEVAQYLSRLIIKAHTAGIAITLPEIPAGFSPLTRPWRQFGSVVESDPNDWRKLTTPAEGYYPGEKASLDVMQRCLVTLAALPADDAGPVWEETAAALQNLGYLLVASCGDVEASSTFQPFFSIGRFAALAHRRRTLHGDLHPGNFANYQGGTITIDGDTVRTLDRPLTSAECATDLATLRLNCTFEQWEAVKVAYASVWPERALEVFQFL